MRRSVTVSCLILGALFVVEAGWIHAKAMLAQALIARAWDRTLAGSTDARPWPWADTQPVARLMLPARDPLTVLSGASGRNLAFGPVHDAASVIPGDAGNSIIAGHRDTHFRALRALAPGDRVRVERADRTTRDFVVTDRRIVDARTTRVLLDSPTPRLTLVTCYPFDALDPRGPLRWVVTADLVSSFTWHTAPHR